MAAPRKILITGATGKQGGSVLRSLLSSSQGSKFSYIAVTRDPTSASATKLTQNPNVSLVKGGSADASSIFQQIKEPLWGMLLVTALNKTEEAEGKAMVDEAIKANVRHFVFASLDRNDNTQPTNVPHFASKHNIEKYVKERAKETGVTWTFLRPVAFMDNLYKNFLGKGFASMWSQVGNKRLQLVATGDIGYWGAKCFLEADGWGRNNAVSIAGDELNYEEAAKLFQEKIGRPMPTTFGFMGSLIKTMSHEMGSMFRWFEDVGFAADIPALRKEAPQMKTFGQWLVESSQFKDEAVR